MNSPLVVYTKLSPNVYGPRNHAIDTVTIHCVVGQCTLESLGEVFQTKVASSNYGVDKDGRIGMYAEESVVSKCSSFYSNDNRAVTIEVASDTFHPFKVTDAAFKSLIILLVDVCKRNNIKRLLWKGDKSLIGQIDKQNMTVHRWFAKKACPGDYLYNLHSEIAAEVNLRLEEAVLLTQIANEAGLTEEQTLKALGVLVKFANTKEDEWEKNGSQRLNDLGLMSNKRDGRELVEYGELGVILDNLVKKIKPI